jgi:hypothetical protein
MCRHQGINFVRAIKYSSLALFVGGFRFHCRTLRGSDCFIFSTSAPSVVCSVSSSPNRGHAWARKSLENMDESLIFGCDPRKLCEEWNL